MALSELLKARTLTGHQELEKKLVGKIRGLKSISDYSQLLRLFYAYFGGLEQLMLPFVISATLPDLEKRRKATFIAADLYTLSAITPSLATAEQLPNITNTAEALGAMYVMEGSTLGGQFIKKMISNQLGIDETYAMSFFNGYGQDTPEMWSSFKRNLDNCGSPENDETIILAANQTFIMFSALFDQQYQ